MKKILNSLLLLLLIFFTFSSSFAQEWEKIKIDSIVSIKMPNGFSVSDTVGQTMYSSPAPFGTMMFFKTSNDTSISSKIDSKRKLSRFYDDYMDNIKNVVNGTIVNERDTTVHNFLNKIFTLRVDTIGFVEFRHFHVIFTNDAIYTFEFLNREDHEELSAEYRDQFFNGIEMAQVSQPHTGPVQAEIKKTKLVPKWLYYAVGVLFIFIAFIVIRSPKRKT